VFQKNSAGLGVPRGSLGSLNKISSHVEQHGSATMQVYAAAPSAGFVASGHGGNSGPVTLRAGAPVQSANRSDAPVSRAGSYGGSSTSSVASHSVSAPSAGGGSSGSAGRGGSGPK
jgi:hypothetical protein